jgi:hypothetical protein
LKVYRYSIYGSPSTPKRSSIVPSNTSSSTRSDSASGKSLTLETASALENALAEGIVESDDEEDGAGSVSDSGSDEDEMSEGSNDSEPARLDRPIIRPVKEYRGAGNVRTVKDGMSRIRLKVRHLGSHIVVNFLGPNDEFITSGSDDGNWFLWSKKSGEVLGIWEGVFC